ncbi:ribose-phosphate pyrophosphokinase [Candidatus Karelsulcia muelleri CARI]|uniref:Ribose-phosphate pyrophosphokinase n=1 Tax=Karelsulcia muelleri (strain CARI) TaxID=706194 RepID=E0TJ89_KARMC|nr:ribose-phosphate pyrophosphokinase [Candidatus Karelsulcia muelleri CARI]
MKKKIYLFSMKNSFNLSKEIAHYYGNIIYSKKFYESVRGYSIFLIGSILHHIDDVNELLFMCNEALRVGVKNIILIIPFFKLNLKKDFVFIKHLFSNLIAFPLIKKIITMDLNLMRYIFNIKYIDYSIILKKYLKKKKLDNISIAYNENIGVYLAKIYAKYLKTDIVFCFKKKNKLMNNIKYENIKNKNLFIIDNLVFTANTILMVTNMFKHQGAKSIRAIVTHPVLSENAYKNIEKSFLEELIVSNTIEIDNKKLLNKISILTCAKRFAEFMHFIKKK